MRCRARRWWPARRGGPHPAVVDPDAVVCGTPRSATSPTRLVTDGTSSLQVAPVTHSVWVEAGSAAGRTTGETGPTRPRLSPPSSLRQAPTAASSPRRSRVGVAPARVESDIDRGAGPLAAVVGDPAETLPCGRLNNVLVAPPPERRVDDDRRQGLGAL